jgi:hypothetical protein
MLWLTFGKDIGIAASAPRAPGSARSSPADSVEKFTVRLRYPVVWLDVMFWATESCQRSKADKAEALW